MIHGTLQQAAEWAGGALTGPAGDFRGVTIDSRRVEPQQIFVALAGERTDGHRHAADAVRNGAAAALVANEVDEACPQIRVDDTLLALGRLARAWRARFDVPVIGVTGSNGKTTVKAMLAAILGLRRHWLVTRGNYNNEIGVPLTLVELDATHVGAVVEMGCARPGDIAYLAELAGPQVGLITNAAPAHLEGMGSVQTVAATKGELFAALPKDGCAVINADDDHADFWRDLAKGRRIVTFGLDHAADLKGDYRVDQGERRLAISTAGWQIEVTLRVPGIHNARNALAAAAVASTVGADPDDMARALTEFRAVDGRLEARRQPGGWLLLEDSYNANPASLAAGVAVLVEHPGERWLVLGDMAELGPDEAALHFQAGANARRAGVERLFAVGPLSHHAVQAFGEQGAHFDSKEALVEALRADLKAGVVCLVKGSRSARMEEVSRLLTGEGDACS